MNLEIERIDFAGKRLIGQDGDEFRFERLILATGARPRTLDLPGANGDNLLYLRSLSDSVRLRDRLKSARKVVVIGSGFIGMEVASQAAQQGCDTTMVFAEDLSCEFWGDTTGAERTEYRGDVHSSSFSAWWLKGDRVVAAFAMNRPGTERDAASQLQMNTKES